MALSHPVFRASTKHKVGFRLCFASIAMAACSGHSYADVYATFESGRDAIVLMTNQCPSDKTGQLKLVISKIGGNVREGCYVINVRGNPVVKWQDGLLQELDGTLFRFDPSQAIVKMEVRPPPATLMTIDIKNNLEPVYSLNSKSSDNTENFNKNLQPYAYYSNGRSISGTIKYNSPMKPWLLAERLSGPSNINKSGILFNFGPFTLENKKLSLMKLSSPETA